MPPSLTAADLGNAVFTASHRKSTELKTGGLELCEEPTGL